MAKKSKETNLIYLEQGIDLARRVIFLDKDIDNENIGPIIRAIQIMEIESSEAPITIFINSTGGEVYSGIALFDLLEASKCPIQTICMGGAMSMAFIIFLAGDMRLSYPNATFMAHSLSGGIFGKVQEMKVDLEESKRLNNVLLEILGKKTNKSKKWWAKEIQHEDKYYDVKRAIKLGILSKN